MEINYVELNGKIICPTDIAESICKEALDKFKEFFDMDTIDEIHSRLIR